MTGSGDDGSGAIFALPTTDVGQLGPVAGWISASGWAAAAQRELGHAWIVTPQGILDVEEVRRRASAVASRPSGNRRARRSVPPVIKTLVKDVREAGRARRFRFEGQGPWSAAGVEVRFVWQRHELFHRAGIDLATELGVPSVLFVPALTVWQAEQWGVTRPGWGRWLERRAEAPALLAATLVACGTEVVAEQVARLGVADERVLVTPTGVDLGLFSAPTDRAVARRSLGLGPGFVIGWSGSFRAFHELDQLVEAAAGLADATLLLVGDGPERARIERLVTERGVRAHFTGLVAHDQLPEMLAAMDVGVVLGRGDVPFHYSPLKVAEYLAAGLPVVAPEVVQLTSRLERDQDAVFYPAGAVGELTAVLQELGADPERRARLAINARDTAAGWSWDRQVQRVLGALP